MKKAEVFAFIFLGLVLFSSSQAFSVDIYNDTLIVKVNLLEQVASVDVTPSIHFGNLTKGYSTNDSKIDINNTGTADITVTPLLNNASEKIFKNLYFQRRVSDPYKKIGSFSMNLSKPSSIGGSNEDYCYVKLDLTNYSYTISSDSLNYQTNIVFLVMPA